MHYNLRQSTKGQSKRYGIAYLQTKRERGREIWCISTQSEMNGENAMLERLLNKEEGKVMGGRSMVARREIPHVLT